MIGSSPLLAGLMGLGSEDMLIGLLEKNRRGAYGARGFKKAAY